MLKTALKIALLSFALFSSIVSAKSEKEVVDAFFKALTSSNFALASEQMDPAELEQFHELFIEIAKSADANGKYKEFSVGPFAKYSSIKEFENTQPISFFTDFLDFTLSQNQQMIQLLNNAQYKFIGTVKETEKTSYAVIKFAMQMAGETIEVTDVVPLIKNNDSYRLGLKADMKIMAQAFKAQVAKI
ncbi:MULTISPECIES: hypothetical protein [unclassified Pseudoalteromonas]|uniref:hypothetical protein n=1 Tax=unclassified Pseudoalteromonas TaxID=194690 RepID=UPI0020984847|nr:hypothetical protein [Pseudoalteromonas sp. XMcav2-N]MCO7188576.1 hypothetical protein [Pseudoalteromonas sp. XMcav2-N]